MKENSLETVGIGCLQPIQIKRNSDYIVITLMNG